MSHPVIEAGLQYWRDTNRAGKYWAKILIQQYHSKPPLVRVTIGPIYNGRKQVYIMDREYYIVRGQVRYVDKPHS